MFAHIFSLAPIFLLRAVGALSSVLLTIIVVRYLDIETSTMLLYLMQATVFLGVISKIGLDSLFVANVKEFREKNCSEITLIKMIIFIFGSSLIFGSIFIAFFWKWDEFLGGGGVLGILLTIYSMALAPLLSAVMNSSKKFIAGAFVLNGLVGIISIVVISIVLKFYEDSYSIYAYLTSYVLSLSVGFLLCLSTIDEYKGGVSFKSFSEQFSLFYFSQIVNQAIIFIPSLYAVFYISDYSNVSYNLVLRLAMPVMFIMSVLNSLYIAEISEKRSDKQAMDFIYNKIRIYSLCVSVFILLIYVLVGERLIYAINKDMVGLGFYLITYIAILTLNVFIGPAGVFLAYTGRVKFSLFSDIFGFFLVLLIVFFIKSDYAPIYALLVGQLVQKLLSFYFLKSKKVFPI
jgi:O-antigen/teichoic acid export membrane protein